jgi:hypothetical protein
LRAAVKDGAAAASEVSATAGASAAERGATVSSALPTKSGPGDASNTSTSASGTSIGGDANDEGSCQASSSSATAEAWERYNEPESQRVWFWNKATDEVFWADDPDSGWEQYFGDQGRPWWCNEAEGRFFPRGGVRRLVNVTLSHCAQARPIIWY